MYNPRKKLMSDMDKTQLLRMRDEEGMTLAEIARAVGCSASTVQKILGPMTPEQREARRRKDGAKGGVIRWTRSVERKAPSFMPQKEEEEPVKAVLAVKQADIRLSGAFMHYAIPADRKSVEVETEEGRVLLSVPAEKLDAFIEELTAIQKNIGQASPMQFWG